MKNFPLERLPDAKRTVCRLAICLVPAIVVVMILPWDRYSGYDPVQFAELLRFDRTVLSGFMVAIVASSLAVFATWQMMSRSLWNDDGGAGWLSLHGWEGEVEKLPQRGLLPIAEILGLVMVTGICSLLDLSAMIFLPLCWSLARLFSCWRQAALLRPYLFGAVYVLHGGAILWSKSVLIGVFVELAAITLTESLLLLTLRRTSADLMSRDIRIVNKQTPFGRSRSSSNDHTRAINRLALRLYPFAQLNPHVIAGKPSWGISSWTAAVTAWVTFCITSRIADLGSFTNNAGVEFSCHGIVDLGTMAGIQIFGILRTLGQFEPFVWAPRFDATSRIFSLRLSSWDRFFLPTLLMGIIWSLAAVFRLSLTPAAFFVLVCIQMMILLRFGVTPEEWQMTSDSRLSSTFLSDGSEDRRTSGSSH